MSAPEDGRSGLTGTLRTACVQVNAGLEIAPNLEAAAVLIRAARAAGAQLITMPENVSMIAQGRGKTLERVRTEAEHPGVPFFTELARETGAWLLVGSLGILLEDGRVANRSMLINAEGRIVARYDKIHMFDVDLDGGESYRESATYRPGESAAVADTPWGRIGMTICYDLRFPHLHRVLAKAGAAIITVPAAFTVPTGRAHWHVLLRARAIETGCFVIAPAQVGTHDEGRQTYGHSLIIDPWGNVLADAGEEVGFIIADLDLATVAAARAKVPALIHDRAFELREYS